jgi:formate hydrogenlyase transcriptional activator
MDGTTHAAVEPYLTLLDVAKAIASHHNVSDLFQDLTGSLHRLLEFHYLSVVLYDAAQHLMRLHNLESSVRGTLQTGAVFAVEDIPSGCVWQHQQPLIVRDLVQETRFPRSIQLLREHGVQSFCSLPLTTVQRRLGALLIGRPERGAYTASEGPSRNWWRRTWQWRWITPCMLKKHRPCSSSSRAHVTDCSCCWR